MVGLTGREASRLAALCGQSRKKLAVLAVSSERFSGTDSLITGKKQIVARLASIAGGIRTICPVTSYARSREI